MKKFINNDRALIRKGGRYTVPFSKKELKSKIMELTEEMREEEDCVGLHGAVQCLCWSSELKHSKVLKDLSKVLFGIDNLEVEADWDFDYTDWLGFHTSSDGFSYLGCLAGRDTEYPIYFAIYWDGKDLRGYIPQYQNTYNIKTKEAFGCCCYDELEEKISDYIGESFDLDTDEFESDGLFEDIESRVVVRGSGPAKKTSTKDDTIEIANKKILEKLKKYEEIQYYTKSGEFVKVICEEGKLEVMMSEKLMPKKNQISIG